MTVVAVVQEWLQSIDATFFEEGIHAFVYHWKNWINLNDNYMEKEHSSTGNIYSMFYLYDNKHIGLVNFCNLLSGYLSY